MATNTSIPTRLRPESGRPTALPPALAAIAAGRDYICTNELAEVLSKKSQTLRKNYWLTGSCFGIQPVKVGRDLRWPVKAIAALLNGEAPPQVAIARDMEQPMAGFIRIHETQRLKAAGLPWHTYGKVRWAFKKRHENGLSGAFVRQGRLILVNVDQALKLLAQQSVA